MSYEYRIFKLLLLFIFIMGISACNQDGVKVRINSLKNITVHSYAYGDMETCRVNYEVINNGKIKLKKFSFGFIDNSKHKANDYVTGLSANDSADRFTTFRIGCRKLSTINLVVYECEMGGRNCKDDVSLEK